MIATRLGLVLLNLAAVSLAITEEDFTDALRNVLVQAHPRSRAPRSHPRQVAGTAGVSQAIVDIGTSLAAANNTVIAFDGSLGGLIDVNGDVVDLGDVITTSTNTITATPPLNPTDS